jgi:hypothetical protein
MSIECVDPKYIEIAASLWLRHNYIQISILYSYFGNQPGTSSNCDVSCSYSYCIVSIDYVDVTYIGIDTNMRSLAFLV